MRALVIGWRDGSNIALGRLGVDVVCIGPADKAERAATDSTVGLFVPAADVTDIEDVVFQATRLVDEGWDFDAVATGSEYPMVCSAVVGAAIGVRALSIDTARLLRDKVAQKNAVRNAGIAVADSWLVTAGEPLPAVEYPAVVKPPAGAGAENTVVVRSEAELARAVSRGSAWLVERFVNGAEMQIDGVVRGGVVLALTVSRYLSNLIHIHDGDLTGAVVVPRGDEPALYAKAEELVTQALRALDHTDGVFHLEAFEIPAGLVFSECGGRVSGGGSDRAILLHTGIDIHEQWARAALNLPAEFAAKYSSKTFGDVQLPAPAGRIERLPTEPDIYAHPGVVDVRLHVKPGDEMPFATRSSVRAATVVVSGETVADVRTRMADIHKWFASQTVVAP